MSNPIPQANFTRLKQFRQQVYNSLSHSKDAFFEMLDAVIQTSSARSFAELSLAPAFQRQWPSLYKALEEVTYDKQALDELCLESLPTDQVAHIAIDVTSVRRMCSPTLKERLYCHGAAREVAGSGMVIGLPYSIVAWESQRGSSFSPPINIQRLEPDQKATTVAADQVLWMGLYAPSQLEWRAALDGAYGNRQFFSPLEGKAVQVVARTRCDSVLARLATPDQYCGRGRHPIYGPDFRCPDEQTWGQPDEELSFDDSKHGRVQLQLWRGLGLAKKGGLIPLELLRSRIHTEREQPPEAHWYLAHNGKPEQVISARRWYETIVHRWGIEPANRFRKERLYAELPKVRQAKSSDHWLMAVQLIEWQLYLTRTEVTQKVLPLAETAGQGPTDA
ncbi:MAG: transposase [Blastocatellia bacterium]